MKNYLYLFIRKYCLTVYIIENDYYLRYGREGGIDLKKLNPEKLFVTFQSGVTPINLIIPRRYTLTHSDLTADLFLTVGRVYAYDEITPMRDEVRGKWVLLGDHYKLFIYVYVGGLSGKAEASVRYQIFVRELPLALEALCYGDRLFFANHPTLNVSPIWVHFQSIFPEFNHTEYWGMPKQYH